MKAALSKAIVDEQNRLVGVELNSTPVVSYQYDSASRMIQRVEGGTTTNYHWDGWDLIREEKSGIVNETTNYLVPFGEVLAFERGGDWFYLHGDALSSTQLVTDENGDQVGRFIYGAWGEELYASESIPGILENRFVGGLGCRRDSAAGLVYMRHRWYDPTLQRFISRDPLGLEGDDNLFSYTSNPMNFVDSEGLQEEVFDDPKEPTWWSGSLINEPKTCPVDAMPPGFDTCMAVCMGADFPVMMVVSDKYYKRRAPKWWGKRSFARKLPMNIKYNLQTTGRRAPWFLSCLMTCGLGNMRRTDPFIAEPDVVDVGIGTA